MLYEMGGTVLSKTVKEKVLGVTMNANMKVSEQCIIAASKCNQVLGMIRRNILTRFNKIAIQGTPQTAVDKEAICLSRVYSNSFKCNLPLFYV